MNEHYLGSRHFTTLIPTLWRFGFINVALPLFLSSHMRRHSAGQIVRFASPNRIGWFRWKRRQWMTPPRMVYKLREPSCRLTGAFASKGRAS